MAKWYWILVVFLVHCQNPETGQVQQLSDEQLKHLMIDLQLSETVMQGLSAERQDTLKQLFWQRMSEVYGMREEELRKEISILESQPQKLKQILEQARIEIDSIR
jgi:hypothetical protein